MQTLGIKDLQKNPAKLTKALQAHELSMITNRSTPIGIAVSFDENIISSGLKTSLLLDAYKSGSLSLGQLASGLQLPKSKVMKMLSLLGIDVVAYDFDDELKTMEVFE